MRQSSIDLLFEHLLPPFKIKNMVWFWHHHFSFGEGRALA
jgi:hypothetical protein